MYTRYDASALALSGPSMIPRIHCTVLKIMLVVVVEPKGSGHKMTAKKGLVFSQPTISKCTIDTYC